MSNMTSILRSVLVAGWAVCVGWCIGCGSGEPPAGGVAGKVTFQGQPLIAGTVTFLNAETGIGASSELDSSGSYRIDSVRAGEYQVTIQPPPGPSPEAMAEGAKVESSPIPDKYKDPQASGLTAAVNEGENTANFDLK